MPLTSDITATYRGPRRTMRRILGRGTREDRALACLMAGCVLAFVSQWPVLARQAHLTDAPLPPMLGGALMGWIFIAPLFFYALAAVSRIIARLLGGQGDWFGARMALFWAWLAAAPVLLLYGLVRGFIGDGPAQLVTGALWCLLFVWFWLSSLIEAESP